MSDALLSVAVGGTMTALSTAAIGYSVRKIKKVELDEKKIPMMGVMGAFVFAAQMINFTIPVTGSSGHIGGGILLTALLGPYPALITLASVLLIQCLFFADGGLLALGANIFNMGVLTSFIAYPLIYKPIVKKAFSSQRITMAAVLSVIVGLQLGSFAVVLETLASGITELPFVAFVSLMQPIHLAIGFVEGIITAGVLVFIYNMRSEILEDSISRSTSDKANKKYGSIRRVLVIMLIATVLTGGFLSLYASSNPDGLEWSIKGVAGTSELEVDSSLHNTVKEIQDKTAILPDYNLKEELQVSDTIGTSLSGILGGLFTLCVAGVTGIGIMSYKKRKNAKVS
jgi:cobalt/nickel transport system permease protein